MPENKEKLIQDAAESDFNFIKLSQKKHVKMVENSVAKLQSNIIGMVSDLPKKKGNLIAEKVAIKQAQQIHKEILKLFETEWSSTTRSIIDDFAETANQVQKSFSIVGESVSFTGTDKVAMDVLQNGYWNEYLNIGAQKRDQVIQSMYDNIIAGQSFENLISSIQGALLGKKSVTGRPLSTYARLFARDQIMNYSNEVTLRKAEDLGIDHFLYVGNVIATSRKFCKTRAGKVFTKKQINSWAKQPWAGKSGHPFTHRGGYNCRHHWRPIRPEWIDGKKELDIGNWDLETSNPPPPPKPPKKIVKAPKKIVKETKVLSPSEKIKQEAKKLALELKKTEDALFTKHRIVDNNSFIAERIPDNKSKLELHKKTDAVFTDLKKRFPGVKKHMDSLQGTTSIGYTNSDHVLPKDIGSTAKWKYGGVSYGDKIMIGGKNIGSPQTDLFLGLEYRDSYTGHNVGWSYECILRHELGHRYAKPTGLRSLQDLNTWSEGHVEIFGGKVDPVKVTRAYVKRYKKEIKKEVSEYASTSIAEFFSETFAAYTSPYYKKGMLAKDIEDLFKGLEK